jgi:hypothetical protein
MYLCAAKNLWGYLSPKGKDVSCEIGRAVHEPPLYNLFLRPAGS